MTKLLQAFTFTSFFLAAAVAGAMECWEIATENGKRWLLENDRLRVEIDPARGARVDSFVDKQFPLSVIRDRQTQALFADHSADQGWPGMLWDAPYQARRVDDVQGETALECRVVFHDALREKSDGVVVRKTYRMRDGEAGLRVTYVLENPTKDIKVFAFWVQNLLQLGKDVEKNVAVRPYATGVTRFEMLKQTPGWAYKFWPDTTAPWTGMVDPSTGQAVVFTQEWDFLKAHYNAGSSYSVEWFMERVSIPPGEQWKTECAVWCRKTPVQLIAFSDTAWAAGALTKDENAIWLEIGAERKDAVFRIDGVIGQALLGKTFPLKLEQLRPGRIEIPLPAGCEPPIYLSARLIGPNGAPLVIEEFMGGKRYPLNQTYVGGPPAYRAQPPEKKPVFPKPERIELAKDAAKRVLVLHGPFALDMGIKPALEHGGYSVTEGFEENGGVIKGVVNGPDTYEGLFSFGTLVFNNLDASLLSTFQRLALADYFEAGGRVLLLGGTSTRPIAWNVSPLRKFATLQPRRFAEVNLSRATGAERELASLMPARIYAQTWKAEGNGDLLELDGDAVLVRRKVAKGEVLACGISGIGTIEPADYFASAKWQQLLKRLLER